MRHLFLYVILALFLGACATVPDTQTSSIAQTPTQTIKAQAPTADEPSKTIETKIEKKKPNYIPDFTAQTNPYDDYERKVAFDYNIFRQLYQNLYLNSSLQECYINEGSRAGFLDDEEDPEFISEGSIKKGLEKLRDIAYISIGASAFTTFLRADPKEALELARVLRARYVVYEEKNLGLKKDPEGRKRTQVQQATLFLIGYHKDDSTKLNCPKFLKEIERGLKEKK